MTIILLTIGMAIGSALSVLAMRPRLTSTRAERDNASLRLGDAQAEAAAERERAEAAEGEVNELNLAAARAEGEHGKCTERLDMELETARREGEEKLELLQEAQTTMRAVLKDAAGEAFEGSGRKVVELTRAALKETTADNRAVFAHERKNVEQLVTPMKDGLTKLGDAVDKLDRDRERQHAEMGEQMRAVVTGQAEVRGEAAVLSRALTQPKAAGDWGEFHLKRLVEAAGMSDFCDFTAQALATENDERLRPDLLIEMPGEKVVVVDAKTPLAPYREACAATDPEQRDRHLRLFARGVKAHVKQLSAKRYADRFEAAMDFVIMYLPGDQFYSAAIELERSLIEDVAKTRVLIATPATFMGLLRTIAYAWQQDKVAENARDIAQHGCTLYERLCTYLTHVDKISRLVNSLADAQNAAVGSLEHSVLPEARRFPELGAVGADRELPETRPVDRAARSVQAKELPPTDSAESPGDTPALPPRSEGASPSGTPQSGELPGTGKGWKLHRRGWRVGGHDGSLGGDAHVGCRYRLAA